MPSNTRLYVRNDNVTTSVLFTSIHVVLADLNNRQRMIDTSLVRMTSRNNTISIFLHIYNHNKRETHSPSMSHAIVNIIYNF